MMNASYRKLLARMRELRNVWIVMNNKGFSGWQGEHGDGRYLCPEFPVPKVLNGRGMRPGKQSWQDPYPRPPLPNVNSYLTRDAIDKEQLSRGTVFHPTQTLIYQE